MQIINLKLKVAVMNVDLKKGLIPVIFALLSACGGGDNDSGITVTPTPTPTPDPVSESDYLYDLTGNLGTHDPTFIQEGDTWYEFQTGVGIYGKVSGNGLAWDPVPSVLPAALAWWADYVPNHTGNDVWAPDASTYAGRAWLYYSVSTFGSPISAIGLLSADSFATANWQDEGLVINSTQADNFNAIDPNLTLDANGDPWMVFGSWWSGIKLTQLDSDETSATYMKPIGTLFSVAAREGGIEGPTIIYRDNYYYLFISVGICCQGVNSTYRILYGRSADITGPYLDKDGVDLMATGGTVLEDGDDRWIGPGGQDIATVDGIDIITFHAYDARANGNATLQMATLNWDQDGWPFLGVE